MNSDISGEIPGFDPEDEESSGVSKETQEAFFKFLDDGFNLDFGTDPEILFTGNDDYDLAKPGDERTSENHRGIYRIYFQETVDYAGGNTFGFKQYLGFDPEIGGNEMYKPTQLINFQEGHGTPHGEWHEPAYLGGHGGGSDPRGDFVALAWGWKFKNITNEYSSRRDRKDDPEIQDNFGIVSDLGDSGFAIGYTLDGRLRSALVLTSDDLENDTDGPHTPEWRQESLSLDHVGINKVMEGANLTVVKKDQRYLMSSSPDKTRINIARRYFERGEELEDTLSFPVKVDPKSIREDLFPDAF